MDKKQFDHIDSRIRQAADQISFPFKEEAWKAMEIKLDNESTKKRRRGLIWWWYSLVLLGIAVAGLYLYNNSSVKVNNNNKNNTTTSNSNLSGNHPSGTNNTKAKDDTSSSELNDLSSTGKNKILPIEKIKTNKLLLSKQADQRVNSGIINASTSTNNQVIAQRRPRKGDGTNKIKPGIQHPVSKPSAKNRKLPGMINGSVTRTGNELSDNRKLPGRATTAPESGTNMPGNESPIQEARDPESKIATDSTELNSQKMLVVEPLEEQKEYVSPDSLATRSSQVKLDRGINKGMYFLASTAADVTAIRKLSIGATKPVYGFGIGYRFNKRLSVQSGFYFGKKAYSAGPGDYKLKTGSYIARIISADAECYIYDIPVTVRYDLFYGKKSNLYLAAGVSSIILKSEKYDMHFYNPNGMYRRMAYTYNNNADFLSVSNFSIGYEHRLYKALYIQAEPYLKLPLAGLGEGSIKLYSAGMQLGVKYHFLKQ